MKKLALAAIALAFCTSTRAEWFQVKSVTSYNQITAIRPNEPNNEVTIRINNLENIEDIQQDRTKVLLSGQSAKDLAKATLQGQLVRIENLTEDSGIFTGDVYLSYEQMVRGYAKQRLVGGQTITPEIKATIQDICRRMLRNLDTATFPESHNAAIPDEEKREETYFQKAYKRATSNPNNKDDGTYVRDYFTYDDCYGQDYLKGIFTYEALSWFKDEGQFLPINIQKTYLNWLSQYQVSPDQKAKDLEKKIRDMTVRYRLYRDFLFGD